MVAAAFLFLNYLKTLLFMNNDNAPNPDPAQQLPKSLITVEDVAIRVNMSESTVRKWCRELLIEHIQVDRKYLFEPDEVESFLARYRKQRGSM